MPANPSPTATPFAGDAETLRSHLEMIQATIARMAGNSFLLKGWTVTLTAALAAFAAQAESPWVALVGLFPTLAFWWLDAYYLAQERLYRNLFDAVRRGTVERFSMNATSVADKRTTVGSAFRSRTVFWLHGVNLAVVSATPMILSFL